MKSKLSYLLHPIFDAFLGLKWKRVSLPFYFHLTWTFAYTFIIMCYSLKRFSILKEVVIPCVFGDLNIIEFGMTVLFPESIIERIFGFAMSIHVIAEYVQNSRRTSVQPCKISMAIKVVLSLLWHFSHPVLIGFLLYGDLSDWLARIVTSVLLFLSALLNIFTLAQLPSFGIQINMTRPESGTA